jgi:polar amino acid transport system substrate-binding protein
VKGALDTMKHDGEYATLLKRYNVAEPTGAEIAQALGAAN